MIVSTLLGSFLGSTAYYASLCYTGAALAYMMSRALRVQIMPAVGDGTSRVDRGNKRRFYFLCSASLVQPFLMWWRTSHLL
jgi:hypothetical protein